MSQLEYLREKLYSVIETGIYDDILSVSQELDKLILVYMESYISINKKTA